MYRVAGGYPDKAGKTYYVVGPNNKPVTTAMFKEEADAKCKELNRQLEDADQGDKAGDVVSPVRDQSRTGTTYDKLGDYVPGSRDTSGDSQGPYKILLGKSRTIQSRQAAANKEYATKEEAVKAANSLKFENKTTWTVVNGKGKDEETGFAGGAAAPKKEETKQEEIPSAIHGGMEESSVPTDAKSTDDVREEEAPVPIEVTDVPAANAINKSVIEASKKESAGQSTGQFLQSLTPKQGLSTDGSLQPPDKVTESQVPTGAKEGALQETSKQYTEGNFGEHITVTPIFIPLKPPDAGGPGGWTEAELQSSTAIGSITVNFIGDAKNPHWVVYMNDEGGMKIMGADKEFKSIDELLAYLESVGIDTSELKNYAKVINRERPEMSAIQNFATQANALLKGNPLDLGVRVQLGKGKNQGPKFIFRTKTAQELGDQTTLGETKGDTNEARIMRGERPGLSATTVTENSPPAEPPSFKGQEGMKFKSDGVMWIWRDGKWEQVVGSDRNMKHIISAIARRF